MLCDKQDTGIIAVMKCLLFERSSDYGKNICIMLRVSAGLPKDEMVCVFWCVGGFFVWLGLFLFLNRLDHIIVPLLKQSSQLAGTKTI